MVSQKAGRYVAYYRVSGKKQEFNQSLPYQRQALHTYAAAHNWEIVAEYQEVCTATGAFPRVEFPKALQAMEDLDADGLMVFDLDRYFRNLAHGILCHNEHFEAKGRRLISLNQSFDTSTDEGWFVFVMFLTQAEYACRKDKRRMRQAQEYKRQQGGYAAGRPRFGAKANKDTHELEEHEDEAAVVSLIKQMNEDGYTLAEIADELNRAGYQTKQKKPRKGSESLPRWSHKQISRILSRCAA